MRVGLALPHYDFSIPGISPADPVSVIEWARRAEALGYDSVWVSDHFFMDLQRYGGPAGRQGSVEPLTVLAAIAALTERVRLGTLVLCAAFRPPATLAAQAAALDRISAGRLTVGIGAGWNDDEFVASGFDFAPAADRMDRLEEYVRIVAGMLTEPPFSFKGSHYSVDAATTSTPVQRPRPPLVVGSKGGPRSLRIVAEAADGWNTVWRWPLRDYTGRARALDRACRDAKRDPGDVGRSVGLYAIVGDDAERAAVWRAWQQWMPGPIAKTTPEEFAEGTLAGTPEQCAELLSGYAALGVDEVIVSPAPLPFAIPVAEQADLIAERLIPLARDV